MRRTLAIVLVALSVTACGGGPRASARDFDPRYAEPTPTPPPCRWRLSPTQYLFAIGSAELRPELQPEGIELFREAVDRHREGTLERIRVRGHYAVGCEPEDGHPELAVERARAVAARLLEEGIPSEALSIADHSGPADFHHCSESPRLSRVVHLEIWHCD